MPSRNILLELATPVVWADSTDYSNSDGAGVRTHQLDLTSLSAAAARQGEKADLAVTGSVIASRYLFEAGVEWATAPTDGDVCDFYLGFSSNSTAGTLNPGQLTGSDAAYSGTTGSSLAESLLHLYFVGSLAATNDDDAATANLQLLSRIVLPRARYRIPVVVNNGTPAFHSDAVEMFVKMTAQYPQLQ